MDQKEKEEYTLTPQQLEVSKKVVQDRQSVFICGEAGTGKSFLVYHLRKKLKEAGLQFHITATTGISAFHLRGVTMHSCLGVGTMLTKLSMDALLRKIRKNRGAYDRIRTMDLLLIDEISMMSALMWERLNIIFQTLRRRPNLPFGGCQLVVLGDFFQLLPVFEKDEEDTRLLFESEVWGEMFGKEKKNIFVLKKNFRQSQDLSYSELLRRVRRGDKSVCLNDFLVGSKDQNDQKEDGMYLVATRKQAQTINSTNLDKLDTPSFRFDAVFSGTDITLLQELKQQFTVMNMTELILKIGCRVMLISNLDISRGLINGSMGTVQHISQSPLFVTVVFDHIRQPVSVTPFDWTVDDDETKALARQIPLVISYAITIHKSQSLTLEKASLELSNCFAPHQAYVALSRLKTKKGLQLYSFRPHSIFCDERVNAYVDWLDSL